MRCNLERQFSWLEYLPVTQRVAGSSPVRSAKYNKKALLKGLFFILDIIHHLLLSVGEELTQLELSDTFELEASEALLALDDAVPPDDPTLALLATAVVDLLGLTELLVEAPEDLLLDVADVLTELETADAVVLLAALKVAVFEAVAVLADFAAAAASFCC